MVGKRPHGDESSPIGGEREQGGAFGKAGAGKVFAVDSHADELDSLVKVLLQAGIESVGFSSAEELLGVFDSGGPSCVVTELELPGLGGLELQRELAAISPHTTFVFLTRNPEVSSAVAALRGGALDYLEKFWLGSKVVHRVRNALLESKRRLSERSAAAKSARGGTVKAGRVNEPRPDGVQTSGSAGKSQEPSSTPSRS